MKTREESKINVSSLLLLIGTIMGALISFVSNGTFLSIIGGAIVGLIFGAVFNSVIIPHKSSDR